MTIVFYVDNKKELNDMAFDLQHGMYKGAKIKIKYRGKKLGRPKKKDLI